MLFGDIELLNKDKMIGIIGSRDCTEYGRNQATFFARELSKKGYCIVSGMAIGTDTAAHIGAVSNIGRTIAVLGCGLNKIYPKENEWLFHKIIQNSGCIITEYEPNVEANKDTFPARNRIVSGLSNIILVVEAEHRSGTTITAGYAKEQGKIICCLPSNIDSKCGVGTNYLIQQGANLITTPSEIIELIKGNSQFYIKKRVNNKIKSDKEEIELLVREIPMEYKFIYDIIEKQQLHINEICKLSKKNITEVTGILTMLELEEFVEQLPGNIFRIRKD